MTNTPYKDLKESVEEITRTYFKNSKADPLSNRATFRGWDLMGYEDEIVVKIHNAANPVFAFGRYQDSLLVRLNLNNISIYRHDDLTALPHLIEVINTYLNTPVETRRAEYDKGER